MSNTFYGNMINLLNAQFQFDREYSNYKELQDNTIKDGVYIGRHSLVRYEKDPNNLDNFLGVLEDTNKTDLKNLTGTSSFISYLLINNIDLYNTTPNQDKVITIPICSYDTKITNTSDIVHATLNSFPASKGSYCEEIIITAANGVDFNDYEFYYRNNNTILSCYKKDDVTKKDIDLLTEISIPDGRYQFRTLNKDLCKRSAIYCTRVGTDKIGYYTIAANSFSQDGTAIKTETFENTLNSILELNNINGITFNYDFIPSGKVKKVSNDNSTLVCDSNYNYYFSLNKIMELEDFTKGWWVGSTPDEYYTNKDLQFYNKEENKNYNLYKKADSTIYQSVITNTTYDADTEYYVSIPFAHFKVIKNTDNFEINKLIDNYYIFYVNNGALDFDNEVNYDLTVWKKQFINNVEKYGEVTGFKLPNMNYNLIKNGVLTVDEDNKIKGKELRGLGKLSVTYQNDTIDISHDRNKLNTKILGEFNTVDGDIRTLAFPVPPVEVQFGYGLGGKLLTSISDYSKFYQTTFTAVKPSAYTYWAVRLNSDNTITEITQFLAPNKTIEEIEKEFSVTVVAMETDSTAIIDGEYNFLLYKVSDSAYEKTADDQWVLYRVTGTEDNYKVYYDVDLTKDSTYFQLPSFTIDDYGHINNTNNVKCRLPALDDDKFTVEFSNLDANYAKTAGVAYGITPAINFKIGNTSRNSNTYMTPGIGLNKDSTYTWTLEDLGLEIGEGKQGETRYPVASNLKNVTSITIGNETKTVTLGKDNIEFTLNEIGAIPLSTGVGENDLLINGTQAIISAKDNNWQSSTEGIEFNKTEGSFKIGDIFKFTPNGAEATLKQIVLMEGAYGIDLPTDPVEGQLFFKLEDASLEGGI